MGKLNSRIKKTSNYKFLNYPSILCPSSTAGHKNNFKFN